MLQKSGTILRFFVVMSTCGEKNARHAAAHEKHKLRLLRHNHFSAHTQLFRSKAREKAKKNLGIKTIPRQILAAGEGFEPSQTESESGVLPLHKPAICSASEHLHYTDADGFVNSFFAICEIFLFRAHIQIAKMRKNGSARRRYHLRAFHSSGVSKWLFSATSSMSSSSSSIAPQP